MQSQIFIYIMVLIVAAGILIYGYQAIKGFKTQADDVLYLEFEATFKNDLSSISFGSVRVKTYELPAKIELVCFKDVDVTIDDNHAALIIADQAEKRLPLIEASMRAGTNDNVFLYPRGDVSFFSGSSIDLGGDIKFKCFDVKSNRLNLRIEGQGKTVLVIQ